MSDETTSMGLKGFYAQISQLGANVVLAGLLIYVVAVLHPQQIETQRIAFTEALNAERQENRENVNTLAQSMDKLADAIRQRTISEVGK